MTTRRQRPSLRVAVFASAVIFLGVGMAAGQEQPARPADQPLRVVYFHSPSCHDCQRVKSFLPRISGRWGGRIALELRNVEDMDVFNELLKYEKHYKATVASPPAIFVGDKALVGNEAILKQLDAAIAGSLANGTATFRPEPVAPDKAGLARQEAVPGEILRRFESFAPAAVALAGLVDGVNPCAFTTIVFFLSMLAYLGKSKRDLAVVVPKEVVESQVRNVIMAHGGSLIERVEIFDVYEGERIPVGTKSLAYGIVFRDPGRTLTEAEVDDLQREVEEGLKTELGGTIRAG